MWLFLILLLVPIIEIALFIQVGGILGLWPTLLIVILTAIIGTVLLRSQGIATIKHLQYNLSQRQSPITTILNGILILISGVVLLTPGFFTDTVGFLLLIPPIRNLIIKWATHKFSISTQSTEQKKSSKNEIIEGEFQNINDPKDKGSSGWTKH